jgi:transposase, IS6 family
LAVQRYAPEYAPELNRRARRELKPTGGSWRVDQLYMRVEGQWTYLNRTVDSIGATIDFYLSVNRGAAAAKHFFRKALAAANHPRPRVINVDGNSSYPREIEALNQEYKLGRRCRTCPYLNNIIERDHRAGGECQAGIALIRGDATHNQG